MCLQERTDLILSYESRVAAAERTAEDAASLMRMRMEQMHARLASVAADVAAEPALMASRMEALELQAMQLHAQVGHRRTTRIGESITKLDMMPPLHACLSQSPEDVGSVRSLQHAERSAAC